MIKLTEIILDGFDKVVAESPVCVPDNVVVKPWKKMYSVVVTSGMGMFTVKETHQEVVRKIMEYKLAMERFKIEYAEAAKHHGDPLYLSEVSEATVKQFAGLEEAQ